MTGQSEAWRERQRAWEQDTLDAAARRSPERKVRFSTISDIEIARLYTPLDWQRPGAGGGGPTAFDHLGDPLRARSGGAAPDDAPGPWADFDPVRDVGYPGEPPFTRGIHPTGYRGNPCRIRM